MSTIEFSVRRRDLAWALALVVLVSAIWVARSDVADAGGSPPGTGIAVVYVAVGTNYPDALGVGPGAGADAAPIIILPTNPPIPAASEAELVRLDPRTVIIIGGTVAISAAMETALGVLLPNATITRISGADRYATNAAFSAATFPIEGWASIPPAAFTGTFPASDIVEVGLVARNESDGVLYAPLQLPHGAEILQFKASVYDNSASSDVGLYLYRMDTSAVASAAAEVGTSSFSGGQVVLSDTTINMGTEIVDNEHYAYFVLATGVMEPTILEVFVTSVMVRYRLGASTG